MKCGMGAIGGVSILHVSKQPLVGEYSRQLAYIAMLGEAFGASYGDILVLVPTTLLRRLRPLLRKHDVRSLEVI